MHSASSSRDPPSTPKPRRSRVEEIKNMSHSTPSRPNSSSTCFTPHTKDTIDPLMLKDIKEFSKNVSVAKWVKAVCGVDDERLKAWAKHFKEEKLIADTTISKALHTYCTVNGEIARYAPFSEILKGILKFARSSNGGLEGIKGLPPVADIQVYSRNENVIRGADEHGDLASDRKPDMLFAREDEVKRIESKGGKVRWSTGIFTMELKFDRKLENKAKSRPKKSTKSASGGGYTQHSGSSHTIASPALITKDVEDLAASTEELEVSETASTGSKRSRGSNSARPTRPPKMAKSSDLDNQPWESSIGATDKKTNAQIGGYALEMLGSTKGTRMHSIVVALRDDLFSLWYFDASGVVRTCSSQSGEKLSLINDFERVAAIFVALVYCTPEQFGAFPTHLIRPPDNTPFPDSFPLESLEGCTINLDTNETKKPYRLITLGRHIYTQYTIVGRRTSVYEGTTLTPKRRRRRVAVKIALQNITRASEINIISLARHKGVDHLPEILNRADLWRLSDSDIRKALEVAYDDRILRVIVTPCYVPLCVQLAKNPDSLTIMVKQIIDCIHDLRHKALILHRDVSEGNIMYKKRDGEDWFLLIDFDLAVGLRENGQPTGPSARHRTGTLPFMAVDLIDDIAAQESANRFYPWEPSLQHSIRHDFESLFWVSLWCAVCVVSSNHKVDPELLQVGRDWLSKWEAPDKSYMSIADRKQKIITKPGELKNAPLSPSFHHLRRWLDVFRACISAGSEALAHWKMEHPTASLTSAANFHLHETGDDEITRSKILEAFENYDKLPTPEPETEEVVAAGDEKYEEIDWSKYSIVVADNPEIEEDYVSGDEEEDY